MISKNRFSRLMKDYFKEKLEEGKTEIDILECNAELQRILDEQPDIACDLCEDDGR